MPIRDLVLQAVTPDTAPDALAAILAVARNKAPRAAGDALKAALATVLTSTPAPGATAARAAATLAAISAKDPAAAATVADRPAAAQDAILLAAVRADSATAPDALRAALRAADEIPAQDAAEAALTAAMNAAPDEDEAAQAALAVLLGGGSTAAQAPGRSAYLPRYQAPLRRRSDDPGAYRSDRYQSQDDEDLYQDGGDLGPPSSTGTMMELTEAIAGLPAAIFRASVDALTGASSQWDREPPPRRWGSRWRPRSSRRSWYDN